MFGRQQAEIISNPALAEIYYKILKMKKMTSAIMEFCPAYIDMLVSQSDKQKVLSAYQECLAINPEFRASANSMYAIAGWMNEKGQSQQAVDTYKRLINLYDDDPAAPRAYFRAAQILHDRLFKMDEAKLMLQELSERYSSHAIMDDVRCYVQSISIPGRR
jgi:tetratricopeptide (TPR) repeat protein